MAKRTQERTPKKETDWAIKFLSRLSETCNVFAACKHAEIGRSTAYQRRERDAEFAVAWDEAIENGIEELELEARRRALRGTLKPVFHKGRKCGLIREYSDTLTIFLLKAHRPDKYRENSRVEVTGKDGGPISYENVSDDQLDAEIARLQAQQAQTSERTPGEGAAPSE